MKDRHVSSIVHRSSRVTRQGFYYRSPMKYLIGEGFIPETLAENRVKSGSSPGAQVPLEVLSFRHELRQGRALAKGTGGGTVPRSYEYPRSSPSP